MSIPPSVVVLKPLTNIESVMLWTELLDIQSVSKRRKFEMRDAMPLMDRLKLDILTLISMEKFNVLEERPPFYWLFKPR
jgi:hypothetical protein